MSFTAALRAAIAASGLSLDELAQKLRAAGTPASASALSTWQTGTSRPERGPSMAALTTLEQILGLAPRALRDSLPARRPRGRRPAGHVGNGHVTALWEHPDVVERLLAKLDASVADLANPQPVNSRYQLRVDRAGNEREMRVTHLVRSFAPSTTRVLFLARYPSLQQAPLPVGTSGCEARRFRADPRSRLAVFEFGLNQPLQHGQAAVVEFGVRYPPGQSGMYTDVRVMPGVRSVALEVVFDPGRKPGLARTYYRSDPISPVRTLCDYQGRSVPHTIGCVEIDPAPGIYGVRWCW